MRVRRARGMQIQATSLQPLPEGENENSPGWSAAEPWEGISTQPPRPVGTVETHPLNVMRIIFNAMLLEKCDAGFKIVIDD